MTVSSILPFAASGSLKPRESLSITIGANLGTTLSALLVAMALPGSLGTFALQAAIVHVLFNLIGALLVLLFPPYRKLILYLSERLAQVAEKSYTATIIAIACIYLVLLIAVISLFGLFN